MIEAPLEQVIRPRAQAAPPVAELVNVTKRYGPVTALDGVSFHANPGEVLAVLGPNGAGKTTAVSIMLGLLKPTSGEVRQFGANPRGMANRMRVGVMLQESGVPATLTVREHLRSFATYYPAPLPIGHALELAGLGEVADRAYGKLSGGQQQRLHFALAMIGNPDLLFLDEPTTGLDVGSRRTFWSHVREFLGNDRTVVLTTHYLEEADALADRVVVLGHGRVVAEGTPAEVKGHVAGRRVHATTALSVADAEGMPGVQSAERRGGTVSILTTDAVATVRALLAADPELADLEVTGASLEEAFLDLTDAVKAPGANAAARNRP